MKGVLRKQIRVEPARFVLELARAVLSWLGTQVRPTSRSVYAPTSTTWLLRVPVRACRLANVQLCSA
jgi:hypothetical protein